MPRCLFCGYVGNEEEFAKEVPEIKQMAGGTPLLNGEPIQFIGVIYTCKDRGACHQRVMENVGQRVTTQNTPQDNFEIALGRIQQVWNRRKEVISSQVRTAEGGCLTRSAMEALFPLFSTDGSEQELDDIIQQLPYTEREAAQTRFKEARNAFFQEWESSQ